MIVECNNCETRFQLEDSRIPARGIRVRCSKCKESFFLERPESSREEAAHDIASRAASSAGAGVPDATQDLPESDVVAARSAKGQRGAVREDRAEAATATVPDAIESIEGDEEPEDDWQFSRDVPDAASSSGPSPPVQAENDLEGTADDDDNAQTAIQGGDDAFAGLLQGDESDSDSLSGSGLSLMGEPEAIVPSIGATERRAGVASAAVDQLVAEVSGSTRSVAEEDPEEWDFFGDDGLEDEASGLGGGLAEEFPSAEAPVAPEAVQAPQLSTPDPFESESQNASLHAMGVAIHAFGWGVVALLVGLATLFGLQSRETPPGHDSALAAIGGSVMDVREVESYWLENVYAGELFVVVGEVRNPGRNTAALERSLAVVPLDGSGAALEVAPALVSVAPAEQWLRELPVSELEVLAHDGAVELAWIPIEGATSVSFAAWFADLPDGAASFRFQAEPARIPGTSP